MGIKKAPWLREGGTKEHGAILSLFKLVILKNQPKFCQFSLAQKSSSAARLPLIPMYKRPYSFASLPFDRFAIIDKISYFLTN